MEYRGLRIKRLYDGDYELPAYETDGSSGMDVRAYIDTEGLERGHWATQLPPHTKVLISTGFAFKIPSGFELQVRPRSGLALRGIQVANSPGTIDSDYTGEVKVILSNTTDDMFYVNPGDRIAQLVLCPVVQARLLLVDNLEETNRGARGFGSTGIS